MPINTKQMVARPCYQPFFLPMSRDGERKKKAVTRSSSSIIDCAIINLTMSSPQDVFTDKQEWQQQ